MKQIIMGNAAIALGAFAAGVDLVAGYPGTPSTEILETIAAKNDGSVYVEWSTNEKAAVEVAAGAAYSGAKTLVTMKQVGLNVASDPVMCLSYIGTGGGAMVIAVADDPGPISSQTEQDTRAFAKYANIPLLDPSSPEEAYEMTRFAFALSEKISKPVIIRPTTRVCHATIMSDIDLPAKREKKIGGFSFVKDPKYVIFPPLANRRHSEFPEIYGKLAAEFAESPFNKQQKCGSPFGIAAGGVTFAILCDVLSDLGVSDVNLLKIGTVFPSPAGLYQDFIKICEKILVLEELSPVIEEELIKNLSGAANSGGAAPAGVSRESISESVDVSARVSESAVVLGKLSGDVPVAGELTYEKIRDLVVSFLELKTDEDRTVADACTSPSFPPPETPMRAPVLCAGCPHRASFYAVKLAMKNEKAVYCGDIGCYTLGNAKPLEMTDTCLCMGAGVTIAQGIKRADNDVKAFAFIGDSTFFASGLTGLANAVYNQADINIIILDNGTTAMTGGQPHPGTSQTLMNTTSKQIDLEAIAKALGADFVMTSNPFNLKAAVEVVQQAAACKGVSVVIFKSPCINIARKTKNYKIENCIGCGKCIREIGCPAIIKNGKLAEIDNALCYGCGLCAELCDRIVGVDL
jgi:indolepyruvate ferredoxin oxidoreductase alpha subunit